MKRALITGITGQDGSYLADHLLDLGYQVWGVVRQTSAGESPALARLRDRVEVIQGDLLDQGSLSRAVRQSRPDEVYNLAAQSFVGRSWNEPVHTLEATGMGAVRLFEAVRDHAPEARVYQASSSEMYGYAAAGPVDATGPFLPHSPYGVAKVMAHHSAAVYRRSHGLHVSCGILFNHESPRRGPHFVTRKVCRGAALAALGHSEPLALGNLEARRDWGWAPDYVRAMHLLLQHPEPLDMMVATGVSHSVRDLARVAYAAVGLHWEDHVRLDQAQLRPAEIPNLTGDPTAAAELLGWRPEVDFGEMIRRMVLAELERLTPAGLPRGAPPPRVDAPPPH